MRHICRCRFIDHDQDEEISMNCLKRNELMHRLVEKWTVTGLSSFSCMVSIIATGWMYDDYS